MASIPYGPAREILVLIAHAQKPSLNARSEVPSRVRDLNFGLSLYRYLYFVYESVHEQTRLSLRCSTVR